jgi:hypothetical protein
MSVDKPFVVACVPAFNEERSIAGVVVQAEKYVDRVVVCDDGSIIGWFVHDSYTGASSILVEGYGRG